MNGERYVMAMTFVLAMQHLMCLGTDMSELCGELARRARPRQPPTLTDADLEVLRRLHRQWEEALQTVVAESFAHLRTPKGADEDVPV
jgi:hypothetical protein